jgi:aconitate hydratase
MGAELGVTTSVFPSDDNTRRFLEAQERGADYKPLSADAYADYDRVIEIDLSQLEPLAACPSSPDNIKTVAQLAGTKTSQVVVGSCTNSSFTDLMMVAQALKGRHIDGMIEFAVAPGSRQVLEMLAKNGALADMIAAGARILESGCGPCIGQGFSPADGVVTLRTFNRNFPARTGTTGDKSYLVSPETAVASAIMGEITDPRTLKKVLGIKHPQVELPGRFLIDDSMIEEPLTMEKAADAQVVRGPTIVVPESPQDLPDKLDASVLLKCGDKITTDHIMPAGAFLKYRSNVPEYAKVVFNCFNEEGKPTFAQRGLQLKAEGIAGVIVAGQSYGQGSSREHAALCPMYLGVRAVIAKSIERIHKANLINFAIVPLEFSDPADYDRVNADDELEIDKLLDAIRTRDKLTVRDKTARFEFDCKLDLSSRDRAILLAAGLLNYTRKRASHR